MSDLTPIADVDQRTGYVRFVPKADSCSAAMGHYSMTSSAAVRSAAGTVRPSALAVFRLMTS